MKLINADLVVHWEAYDDEHESFTRHSGTIAEFLDQMTDEGCPETVDAVPARHGKWVDENGNRPYGYRFNWLCSECGRPQHTSTAKLLKEFEEEHRWCHFCGARMDGKGNGNG